MLTLVFWGEILHQTGLWGLVKIVKNSQEGVSAGVIIANGNGISVGEGITSFDVNLLIDNGIDVVMLGDKALSKPASRRPFQEGLPVLRPLNLPARSLGQGAFKLKVRNGWLWLVSLCTSSETFPLASPFDAFDSWLHQENPEWPVIVNFHGTDIPMKEAFMWHYSGSRPGIHMLGTGLRIPTDDLQLFEGNVYVTDVGSVAAQGAIQGWEPRSWWKRFIERVPCLPQPFNSCVKADGVKICFTEDFRIASVERLKIIAEDTFV